MYFLVLLYQQPGASIEDIDHESFIDELILRNSILLGGPFSPPQTAPHAAYVLRCNSVEEAQAIVDRDPLVRSGSTTATVLAWSLVGVNLEAIAADLAMTPSDLRRGLRP